LSGAGIGLLPWLLKSRFVLSNVAFSVASTTVVLFAFEEATKASATYKESKEAADPNDWTREVLPLLSTLFHLLLPSLIPGSLFPVLPICLCYIGLPVRAIDVETVRLGAFHPFYF